MKIIPLTADHPDVPVIKKLFEDSFPPNERTMDMDTIITFIGKSPITLLGVYPDETPDELAGFFVTVEGDPNVYLVYLAILPEKRSGGIGGKAMNSMRDYYAGKTLWFSYESPFEECDNLEQRERRRNLYLRLGFLETGWYARLNGTEFILACSEENFDIASFEQFFGTIAAGAGAGEVPKLYRKD